MQTIFRISSIVAVMAAMLSFCSCDSEDVLQEKAIKENPDGSIMLSPGVRTKTAYEGMLTSFEDGDEVGIYAVARKNDKAGALQEKGNYADNYRYKYVAASNSFEPIDKKNTIYRYPTGVLDLYVYYPYNTNIVDATAIPHFVFGNQTTKANYSKADMMAAECIGYKDGLATLEFEKLMSCLEVIVNKRVESGVEGLTLKARDNGSVVNIASGDVLTIDNPQPIRMFLFSETDTEYHYRAHLPAQTAKDGEYFADVNLKGGAVKKYNNSAALPLQKGILTRYDITLQSRIKVIAGNGGTVSVTAPDKTGNVYNDGKSIEAGAQAIPGWLFKNWEENGRAIGTDNPYTFVSETNRSITAIFQRGYFKVGTDMTYTNGTHPRLGGNGCSVTPTRTYVFETKAQLTASPGHGFHFSGWTDGNGSSQRWETAGPSDMTYTAKFSRNSYTVAGSASPAEGGSVSGGGSVLFGDPASLSASSSSGYHFTGWSNGSSSSSISIGEVNDDVYYTAYFEADPVVVPPDPGDGGGGDGGGGGTNPDPDPDPEPPVDPENPDGGETPTPTYCINCSITGQGTVSGIGCGKKNGPYTLTAHPASGWSSSWTTRQVTVNGSNASTSVTFTKIPEPEKTYTITVTFDYDGGGGSNTPQSYQVKEGEIFSETFRAHGKWSNPHISCSVSGASINNGTMASTISFKVTGNANVYVGYTIKPGGL